MHHPPRRTPARGTLSSAPSAPTALSVLSALSALFVLSAFSCAQSRPADLIVFGKVWTGDSAAPWAEAVATRGDTIIAVGDSADVARFAGDRTRLLNNAKALVTPGFMDGHVHFLDGGYQ